jgi:hypothetical protein
VAHQPDRVNRQAKTYWLRRDLLAQMQAAATKLGITQIDFVSTAIREKLDRAPAGNEPCDTATAAELVHDALDSAGGCYHDRESGVVDVQSGPLAAALLAAGWRPPSRG